MGMAPKTGAAKTGGANRRGRDDDETPNNPPKRPSIWADTTHPVLGEYLDKDDHKKGRVTEKHLKSLVGDMVAEGKPQRTAKNKPAEQSEQKKQSEQSEQSEQKKKKKREKENKDAEQQNKKQKTETGACARAWVRACACACLRACVRVCVFACVRGFVACCAHDHARIMLVSCS